jgi:hypothetical protein
MGRFIITVGFIASLISIFVFVSGRQSLGEIIDHKSTIEWDTSTQEISKPHEGFYKPETYFYIHGTFDVSDYADDAKAGYHLAIVKSQSMFAPHRLSLIRETGSSISELPLYDFPLSLGLFRGGYGANHFFKGHLFAYTSVLVGEVFDVTALDFSTRHQFGFSATWRTCGGEWVDANTELAVDDFVQTSGNDGGAYRLKLKMTTDCKNIDIVGEHNKYTCHIRDLWLGDARPTTLLNIEFDGSGRVLAISGTVADQDIAGCEELNF